MVELLDQDRKGERREEGVGEVEEKGDVFICRICGVPSMGQGEGLG